MRHLKAADLILDFDLYPRGSIDAKNIRDMAEALAAGAELPPVVICRKTKRVVDGFHRLKAHMRVYGEDAMIDVMEKVYKTDSDLFLDAARLNGGHGAKLQPFDRVHCCLIAERLKIPLEDMAGALHMTVDKLASLAADRTATSGRLHIPIKRTIRHMAGRRLTKRQREANDRLTGMNQLLYVNQLLELIDADLLDLEDENLMAGLRELSERLALVLAASA